LDPKELLLDLTLRDDSTGDDNFIGTLLITIQAFEDSYFKDLKKH